MINSGLEIHDQVAYFFIDIHNHGADDGSLLGISWINPNEIVFFDERMRHIISMIREKGMLRTLSA